MSDLLNQLAELVRQVTQAMGYPGIFLLMLAENLFPPIPSELVMPFAGFIVSEGKLNIFGIMVAGTLGSLVGALIIYEIGRKLGHDRLQRWICRYGKFLLLSPDDLDRALDTFDHHGKSAILIGRLIPGVRSLISIPAGIQHMPIPQFLALSLVGTVLWNSLLVTAGLILGSNWQRVLEILDSYEIVIWGLTGAALLFFIFRRMGRKVPQSGC